MRNFLEGGTLAAERSECSHTSHCPPSHLVSFLALISARYSLAKTLARVQSKPYEYVTVDSPHLASVSEDGRAFAEHLASQEGEALACAIEEDYLYAYCSFSSTLRTYKFVLEKNIHIPDFSRVGQGLS